MSNTVLWESIISQRTEQLQDKINEIIDHLPQEKENLCLTCVRKGCENRQMEMRFCKSYLEHIAKQPTKEVPQEKEYCNCKLPEYSCLDYVYCLFCHKPIKHLYEKLISQERDVEVEILGNILKKSRKVGGEPAEEVDITCNEASFCVYKFQNGSLCGCKFKDWCAYQTPQIDRKPTKEVPDIRGILERLFFKGYHYPIAKVIETNDLQGIIDQSIQEISALYRKEV